MFRDVLAVPTKTDDAVTTVFMGAVLTLVTVASPFVWFLAVSTTPVGLVLTPLLFFPPLVLRGYDVQTVRAGLAGDEATPSFVGWNRLVRDGATAMLLGGVYALPLVVLGVVAVVLAALIGTGRVGPGTSLGVATALGLVVTVVGAFAYGAVYLYLRPAVLAVFATERRFRDALAVRSVLHVASSASYAAGWLLAVGVLVVGLAVGVPTTLVLVGLVVVFYARVVAHLLYGRGAAPRLGVDDDDAIEEDVLTDQTPAEAAPAVQTGRTVAPVAAPGGRSGVERGRTDDTQRATAGTDGSTADRDAFQWTDAHN